MKKKLDTIKLITEVRARNNKLWMGLLELALETSPKRAKLILSEINQNDQEISLLLGWLAESSAASLPSGRLAKTKK